MIFINTYIYTYDTTMLYINYAYITYVFHMLLFISVYHMLFNTYAYITYVFHMLFVLCENVMTKTNCGVLEYL